MTASQIRKTLTLHQIHLCLLSSHLLPVRSRHGFRSENRSSSFNKNGSRSKNVEQRQRRGNPTISLCDPQIYLFNLYLIFIIPSRFHSLNWLAWLAGTRGYTKDTQAIHPPRWIDKSQKLRDACTQTCVLMLKYILLYPYSGTEPARIKAFISSFGGSECSLARSFKLFKLFHP